jgi:hypothetical protein
VYLKRQHTCCWLYSCLQLIYHIMPLSVTLSSEQDASSSNETLGNNESTFHKGRCLHGAPHAALSLCYRPMSEYEAHYINIHYPTVKQKFEKHFFFTESTLHTLHILQTQCRFVSSIQFQKRVYDMGHLTVQKYKLTLSI